MMSQGRAAEPTVHQLFKLTGKRALITGACGYLGQAMARALAEAGASVVASSRQLERAQALAATLPVTEPSKQRDYAVELDHMDERSIGSSFDRAVKLAGGLEVLVNNGHEPNSADWTAVTAAESNRQLANASGYFLLARLLRNHAVERGKAASIVMFAVQCTVWSAHTPTPAPSSARPVRSPIIRSKVASST